MAVRADARPMPTPRESHADGAFVRRILTLRRTTSAWPTADEEAEAERLARALDEALASTGRGEVNGFELGHGTIDVLVFGSADEDGAALRALLAPVVGRTTALGTKWEALVEGDRGW